MKILGFVPQHLQDKAISLSELGIVDYAWAEEDAIVILGTLREGNIAVLGGDVYKLVDGDRVESTFDSWYLDKEPEWSWEYYVVQSSNHTRHYIVSYCERNIGTNFIFNLVTATARKYKELDRM